MIPMVPPSNESGSTDDFSDAKLGDSSEATTPEPVPMAELSNKDGKGDPQMKSEEASKQAAPLPTKGEPDEKDLDKIGPETPFIDSPDKEKLNDVPLNDLDVEKSTPTYDGPPPCSEDIAARAVAMSLASALYLLILLIFALVFEISVLVSDTDAQKYDYFYLYLYIVSIIFMTYVQCFLFRDKDIEISDKKINVPILKKQIGVPDSIKKSVREAQENADKRQKASHSASPAGSLYLRLGMLLFGAVAMIFYGLELYSCAAQQDCNGWKESTLVFGCVFMFFQSYFIFRNSKMVIHRFKHIGKLGVMHMIATNLCIWLKLITVEEFLAINDTDNSTDFSITSLACSTEELSSRLECYLADYKPIMITSLVEYSLISAAILFILWRNIGTIAPDANAYRQRLGFRVDCASTTKGLFVGIIFAITVLITLIIFFMRIYFKNERDALWTFYMADCFFYGVTLAVIMVSMFVVKKLPFVGAEGNSMVLLDAILLFAGFVGQIMFSVINIVSLPDVSDHGGAVLLSALLRTAQVIFQTAFILMGQRLRCVTLEQQEKRPGRELVSFLLVANLSLFLVNAFEVHKAISNPLMMDFYGRKAWAIIVHAAVPLTVFYRFQSSVCLAEIWKHAYRVKQH